MQMREQNLTSKMRAVSKLTDQQSRIKQAQQRGKKYIDRTVSLSDELISEGPRAAKDW
jgi:hypothetical protein